MVEFHSKDFLSAGTNALVYKLDDNWVIRRSMTKQDGFRVIPYIPKELIEKFSLPRIDLARSDLKNHVYVVERLYRANYMDFIFSEDAHMEMNAFHHPRRFKGFCINRFTDNDDPMYEITKKCYHIWRFLRSKKCHVSIDLNPSNIMQRKDGTLILSDPFGTRCDYL